MKQRPRPFPPTGEDQAIESIRDLLDEIVQMTPHKKLVPQGDHRLACDVDEEDLDPEKVAQLINQCRSGDATAEATLRMLVELDLKGNTDGILHESLHPYVLERLQKGPPAAPRGPPRTNNFGRDWLLYQAVERLRQLGFRPTRNRESKTESASSLLKRALSDRDLGIGERAIEDAWKRMNQLRGASR